MKENHLHIIAFNVPYPADYGGVIDVFYKLTSLYRLGLKIHLHCFTYHDRHYSIEVEELCYEVNYYKRKTSFLSALSYLPYIIKSRKTNDLLNKLKKDNYPILFEGLHTTYFIKHPDLKDRLKVYRESNIEHHYYFNLSKSSKKLIEKLYFFFAGIKLKLYQKTLKHADLMLAVSKTDVQYLKEKFPNKDIYFLPSFHNNEEISSLPGKGNYALFHGNLEVAENSSAATYLIKEIFNDIDYPLIISGKNPSQKLIQLGIKYPKCTIISNPNDEELAQLIKEAQLNILITFQKTGLKLKLLNALFKGRFCLVNHQMLYGSGLDNLCSIANSKEVIKAEIIRLSKLSFNKEYIKERKKALLKDFSNNKNAEKLMRYLGWMS